MDENYYDPYGSVNPNFIFTFLSIIGILALIGFVSQWGIFQKAGQPGWAAIIPIYNLYVFLKVVGKPGWWMLLFFVPIVNLFIAIKCVHLLSKSFGKEVGFTLGLLFLSFIFYPILAFGDSKYLGPFGDPQAFSAKQTQNNFEFENAGY